MIQCGCNNDFVVCVWREVFGIATGIVVVVNCADFGEALFEEGERKLRWREYKPMAAE
jgi:hypothetical protein